VVTDAAATLRRALMDRVKLTIGAGLLLGILAIGISPAGGPSAALLDIALLGLALWLSRGSSPAPATPAAKPGAMSANQALLLVLALGGAAVLVVSGAASRPLHGLAVAPFAMAAFALSSHNSRDLRSGVLAAAASLLVLSMADDRAQVMTLCAIGLLPLALSWTTVRQLLALDQDPQLLPVLLEPRRRPWSVAAVLRLAVVTAVLALLMPSEPAPHLHGGGPDTLTNLPGLRGFGIGMSDGRLDLRQRGTLDAAPILQVPGDTPTLWQGAYADRYDGSTWTRTDRPTAEAYPGSRLPRATALPTGPDLTNSLVTPVGRYLSFLAYSPGPIVAVDGAGGQVRSQRDGAVIVINRQDPGMPYTVVWQPDGSSSAGTLSADQLSVTDQRWLALPSELPGRVRTLARTITGSLTSTPDKVSAIETYLRTNERYQLDSPVPAEGVDAVDAFLFTDHVGFCEQFASAETVLLRSLGIPARLATGYGGAGVPGPDGTRVYRNEDAHAWVQVGYAGERWVDSDPTAGSQLAAGSSRHSLISWLTALWKDLTGTTTARRLSALGLLVGAVLVWLLTRLVRRWRPDNRAAVPIAAALQTDAGQAYQRLLQRLAEQKRPRRPTETVRDLLLRLNAPQRETVAGVLEGEWYGRAVAVPAQRVSSVVAIIDDLAAEPPSALSP
jgi:transglutaminase-like putative cysteine protease